MSVTVNFHIFKGEALVGTREFSREIIKIGRLASAHLCLEDDKVSRIHSVIEVAPEGTISIIDMGSTEGTFVNGRRVNKGALNAGDEIRLGGTRLVLGLGPVASVATPAPELVATPGAAFAPQLLQEFPSIIIAEPPAPPALEIAAPTAAAPEPGPALQAVEEEAPIAVRPRLRAAGRLADPSADTGEEGVEVRVFWGETLLGSTFQLRPKEITLGESEGSDFQIPGQGLPFDHFPIVQSSGDELRLVFPEGLEGELEIPGEPPRRLQDLAASRQATPHATLAGCEEASLTAGSFAWVQLQTLRVEVSLRPVPRKIVVPFWEGIDYGFLNTVLVLGFLMLAFVVTAVTMPLDTDTTADDLFRNPTAMAKFLVKPPAKTKNPWVERLKGASGAKGEQAEKHKDKEGAMGKKSAANRNTRSAPKAIDVNAKEVVKNSGLMRLLGGGGGGLSTILGQGGLGGDLKGAIGHMFGPAVGEAGGLGGLGLRGTGNGGGGLGNTIGIGDIGTKGRGGGLGGYGSGIGGMGRKGGSDVAISSGNPIVEGSLDKELIRRVIHAHRSQVRFCYESELVRHPGMNGKVSVKFIIAATGAVQRASIDSSTLGNANVESCIVSRVYQWQFPKPKGGGIVVVHYPFLLKEAGE